MEGCDHELLDSATPHNGAVNERMASVTVTQNFLRTMYGGVGRSLSIARWTRRESVHRAQLAEQISIYAPPRPNKRNPTVAALRARPATYAA